MIPATTPLVGFSGEIIWPLGQISLLVKIGDDEYSTSAWMNFMVVRSPSPYNRIIGRLGVRRIRAVLSTATGMLKFPVAGETITLRSSMIILLECIMASGPGMPQPVINQVTEEKIQVAIHPEYPKQTIAIGSTLTEEGRKELCSLLRRNLDVFARKLADMTGVPRHIAEHRLNIREGVEMAFKQMKRLIAELPMLTAPKEKEELIMYLVVAKEAISAVLMTERDGKQMPIYFVSHFIVEHPEDDPLDMIMEDKEELPDPWVLFTDGSSCIDGSGGGLIITNPEGMEFTYALRFRFSATNNEAEYEALIAGLWIAEQIGVKNLQANVDSRLVANQVNGIYVAKEPDMGIDIAGPFPEGPGKVKFLIVAIDYFTKWIEEKPVATTTGARVKKFVWDNIVCRLGLPGEIISDNEKQFRDNPFKDWCDKLCICQCFTFVKYPQANGLVERENRSLGEGIKARLGKKNKNWVEEEINKVQDKGYIGGRYFGNTIMSDSEDSTVTYTAVSSPFGGLSNIGSPGIDGPPVIPEDSYAYVVATFQAPPFPDYVLGPKYPPSPEFVPEPVYPEFMPPEDDVLPVEEQPLPAALSPTTDSPGYVLESDPEEDPEDDDDEDPEKDLADYPADGGDDGDDEDESSDDEEDDDVDIKGDEEEEEHPAPADSTAVALPAVDHAPFAEETEPFETDESAATPPPHPTYRVTARISIRDEPPTPFWSDTEIPSPPLPPILSPLPVSSPPPASPTYPLGYKAAMIRLRAEAPSTSHSPPPHIILSHTKADTPPSGTPPSGTPPVLPIPLPTSSPPLHLPFADHGMDRPEVCLPPWKRLCITLCPRYEVGESSSAAAARLTGGFKVDYGFVATMDREIMRDLERDVGYGITDTWDEMLVDMPRALATDDTKLGRRMTEFATRVRQDTDDIYVRLDDEQTKRQLMAGLLIMLYRDRRVHARTALLMEREARMSREAWG
ncbi:reverse transcriptase domain-containing protein [Tanacetum coccineum]